MFGGLIVALIIWIVLQVVLIRRLVKLETAVAELLRLHPELIWQEGDDGR